MIETLLMVALCGEMLCAVAGRRVTETYHLEWEKEFPLRLLMVAIVCRYGSQDYIFVSRRFGDRILIAVLCGQAPGQNGDEGCSFGLADKSCHLTL